MIKLIDFINSEKFINLIQIKTKQMLKLRLLNLMVLVSYTLQSSVNEQLIETGSLMFWIYALISCFLSMFAGICSGLTVGYMAINKKQMQMWAISNNQTQRLTAKPILQVLQNHHMLLSTLLLANALSLQALPIFLDKIVPGYVAIIISIIAVVVLGQVIPQSYCTGHNKVKIGYYFSGFVKALECLLYIFVRPIVYVLDNWIGHHDDKVALNEENLKAILYLHNSREYGYRAEQIEILQNTIDLRTKLVSNHMIALQKTFLLNQNTIVNEQLIDKLQKANFSKVPVYSVSKSNIIGYFKVKNLISFKLSDKKKLSQGNVIHSVMKINSKQTLLQLIEQFKKNKKNFAAVIDQETQKCVGIITMKQIFVELVLKEFNDNDIRVNLKLGKQGDGVLDNFVEGVEQD